MISLLKSLTENRSVLILGYGREGSSTFRFLKSHFPDLPLTIADANTEIVKQHPELDSEQIKVIAGPEYLGNLNRFDLIIKSPGIPLSKSGADYDESRIASQTDLFIRAYAAQMAGITGTKGKSTTASLLHHIIQTYTSDTLFAGNIGIPLFDLIDKITANTKIVGELSSHQLEFITQAPKTSILLNLFQEHLDHYNSFRHYQLAKFQIALKQQAGDSFFYDAGDKNIRLLLNEFRTDGKRFPVTASTFEGDGAGISGEHIVIRNHNSEHKLLPLDHGCKLAGTHNLRNIIFAASAAYDMGIPAEAITEGVRSFTPLEHRIEYVGVFKEKAFYNDSISTIPEATMAAVNTLKAVNTLILGGFDRGIDYSNLIDFICTSDIKVVVFTGPAGERMLKIMQPEHRCKPALLYELNFDEAVKKAIATTPTGGICLLSPAASSYDQFSNFAERGQRFKYLIRNS